MSKTIALAGNPNSGKTTLFNNLTGSMSRVGNWPGVTVDKKEGYLRYNKDYTIVDLPGIYSLSPYSAEEIVAGNFLIEKSPDLIVNIVDANNIERNLYLTLQLMETGRPVIIALNMMDEVKKSGIEFNISRMEDILGVPVIPITARNGEGIDDLYKAIEGNKKSGEVIHPEKNLHFGDKVTTAVNELGQKLSGNGSMKYYRALKVLEGDEKVTEGLSPEERKSAEEIKSGLGDMDIESEIANGRYDFIEDVVKEIKKGKAVSAEGEADESVSDRIDRVLTDKYLALPIFGVIMYILFATTFSENYLFIKGLKSPGVFLAELVENGWGILTGFIDNLISGASPAVHSLVIDGVMEGLGAIIGFIPLVLVLYMMISFLEDIGYMARVAFVMDRIFKKFGLSGKAFIPLLMGMGCSVPAINATRTLETEKDRKITTMLAGFMPCGAKLPIFAMMVSLFFPPNQRTAITFLLYILSIVTSIVVSLIINRLRYRNYPNSFLMELPQYRLPSGRNIILHGWQKIKGFVYKAGTVIFLSTIVIWALSNFNINSFNGINKAENEDNSVLAPIEESFLAGGGKLIAPVFKPLGFGEWRPAVGTVTGWIAKENVVVTLAQLYSEDVNDEYLEGYFSNFSPEELEEFGFTDGKYNPEEAGDIYNEGVLFEGADENALSHMKTDMNGKAGALSFMVFNLLCMPCFAAVGAMKRELKSNRETLSAVGIQMLTAYTVAFIIYRIAGMITG